MIAVETERGFAHLMPTTVPLDPLQQIVTSQWPPSEAEMFWSGQRAIETRPPGEGGAEDVPATVHSDPTQTTILKTETRNPEDI